MSGSPPVNRTSRTPSSRCARPTSRMTSSVVIRAASGIGGKPSSGMQYVQRSEHFSVSETLRSRATRPNESMSSGVAGRAPRDCLLLRASDMVTGAPFLR